MPFSAKMSDVLKCKQTTVIKMRTGGGGAETKISTDLKSGELSVAQTPNLLLT